ncbi:MAG: gliding-motility protein MglA [Polyangiales bacterium]
MPLVHHAQREVTFKIVYYGVGLGGKTTNLEALHAQTRPELRGKLVSVNTEAERTLFLDFLPLELGTFRGYTIRLHLVSVPGQIAQDSTRQVVLRNVDGVVLVIDSQADAIEGNNYSIRNLDYNLRLHGVDADRIPLVVQYNKRDLPGILDVEELATRLGVPHGVPELVASARQGWGVFETVKTVIRLCMHELGDPSAHREGRAECLLSEPRDRFRPSGPVSMIHALVPEHELDLEDIELVNNG